LGFRHKPKVNINLNGNTFWQISPIKACFSALKKHNRPNICVESPLPKIVLSRRQKPKIGAFCWRSVITDIVWVFSMPLNQRDHYSFVDTAALWRLSPQDLGYFAERGRLEVRTWLSDVVVATYVSKEMADGTTLHAQVGMKSLIGYYIVEPDELRKFFRTDQPVEIRRFRSLDQQEMYATPFTANGCILTVAALEISINERDRFEIAHNLKRHASPANETGFASPSVGRPSAMPSIIEHHRERVARGEIEVSLAAEARYLRAWAQKKGKEARVPELKTIENNLRPHFAARRNSDPQ
jgi:hypothetical protein